MCDNQLSKRDAILMRYAPLHLGSDLDIAINRMDFFRLFKALAVYHERQCFFLSEVLGDDDGFNLQNAHSLHSMPDSWFGKTIARTARRDDPIVVQSKRTTAPFSMNLKQNPSDLVGSCGCDVAIVVPLHTAAAKRYCLVMCGDAGQPDYEKMASIALDAALIFQRYFEVILSLDSISGLNDREVQIVHWTSEGKTSAEIAIILGLSEHTVNSYIALILRKLNVVNRAQMVASALRSGFIS